MLRVIEMRAERWSIYQMEGRIKLGGEMRRREKRIIVRGYRDGNQ